MRTTNFRTDSRGYTLIEVLVSASLLGLVVWAGASGISSMSLFHRLDRKVKGDQVLAYTAGALQRTDYDVLIGLCLQKNAFGREVTGNCLEKDHLNPALVKKSTLPVSDIQLEVLRDFNGQASPTGKVCVELNRCDSLVQGRMLQVSLKGYWPQRENGAHSARLLTFRRTRW